MKLSFWAIAKTDEPYLVQGIDQYCKRLTHYLPFEYRELKIKKAANPSLSLKAETEEILKGIKPTDCLILLDDKGKQFNSEGFADFLQKRFNEVQGNIVFVAGGAFGFSEEVYSRANFKLSLSALTFTHQMVRLIFLEQLYRGMTILKGEGYHH